MRVEWTYKAQEHLQKIINHYLYKNPIAGDKIIRRIQETGNNLSESYKTGRIGKIRETYEMLVTDTDYYLIYELLPNKNKVKIISIMAVMSGKQKYIDI